jgi:hypothetical protein
MKWHIWFWEWNDCSNIGLTNKSDSSIIWNFRLAMV